MVFTFRRGRLSTAVGSTTAQAAGWRCRRTGHEIFGDRFTLRTLSPEHFDELMATIDGDVMHWQGYPDDHRLQLSVRAWTQQGVRWHPYEEQLAIVESSTGTVIGSWGLTIDAAGIGLCGGWLGAQYRGQGLGTGVLRRLGAFSCTHLGIGVVRAGTEVTNEASRRQHHAAGFVDVRQEDHVLPNGRTVDAVWMHLVQDSPPPECRHLKRASRTRR